MDRIDVPAAIAALPRFPLLDGPSPLQRLPRFSAALGGTADVWIKREDLLPLAFGGNKLRNLEFLVGEALAAGADTLVTSGRRWSNHCRLTAAAGAKAGLAVHLVLTGPPVEPPGPNERLDALLGATVHVAATDARADREALVDRVAADLRGGGPAAVRRRGRRERADRCGRPGARRHRARRQAAAAGISPIGRRPPVGDGRDAGRASSPGCGSAGSAARVVGVAVAAPADELRPTIAGLLDGLAPLAGLAGRPRRDRPDRRPARRRATACRPPRPTQATELLARTEGILVDPIYTAKALAELVARVRDGRLDGDRRVLARRRDARPVRDRCGWPAPLRMRHAPHGPRRAEPATRRAA